MCAHVAAWCSSVATRWTLKREQDNPDEGIRERRRENNEAEGAFVDSIFKSVANTSVNKAVRKLQKCAHHLREANGDAPLERQRRLGFAGSLAVFELTDALTWPAAAGPVCWPSPRCACEPPAVVL